MSLSKQFSRYRAQSRWVCAISFSISAIFLVCAFSGSAQRLPDANATAARNAALITATNEVLKETSELRQLSILRPVPSSTRSRAEIEQMIVQNLERETTPEEIHGEEVTIKKLGLAPLDFDYRSLMIRLLTEQVAGYYDPNTRQFHLADWIDVDGQRPVMAHELTHALQDQHFDLRRFEHWPKGDSDAQLAARALMEGDATLVMVLYVSSNPVRALAFLKSLDASNMSSAELTRAPRAVRETLLFPYQEGTSWVRELYRRGDWTRVSQAFTDLPQSTEQILHPEKYFAHEAPVKISLPDVARLLNSGEINPIKSGSSRKGARVTSVTSRPSSLSGGWRRIDYDVQGEWGFYLALDEFLKSSAESRRAAEGWAGDRYETYEGPNGDVLFISVSDWDSPEDAHEFFEAYARRTELRYPNAEKVTRSDSDVANKVNDRDSIAWKTPDGTVTMNLRNARVLIVEAPKSLENIKPLVNEVSR